MRREHFGAFAEECSVESWIAQSQTLAGPESGLRKMEERKVSELLSDNIEDASGLSRRCEISSPVLLLVAKKSIHPFMVILHVTMK